MLGIAFCISRKGCLSSRALWLNCCPGYNIGTFALPFVQSFLSPACVVACCLFDAGSATMCSGGTYALSCGILGENGTFSFKQIGGKLIRSVPFMSYVVMLIVTVLGVTIPQGLVSFVKPVANANPFLAMFMIDVGFKLSGDKSQIKKIVQLLSLRYGFAVLIALLFWFVLPFELEVRQALVLLAFSPIAAAVPPFTAELKGDVGLSSAINSVAILCGVVCNVILLGILL
jgi:predicted permease